MVGLHRTHQTYRAARRQVRLPKEPFLTGSLDKKTIRDAYVYLMGRAFIIRQEQLDITLGGLRYNQIKYNHIGKPLEWVNPNLDPTNNEAWIAVDDATPTVLEIPGIEGRYYTAQILDEWGEVLTNINERNYPTPASPHWIAFLN